MSTHLPVFLANTVRPLLSNHLDPRSSVLHDLIGERHLGAASAHKHMLLSFSKHDQEYLNLVSWFHHVLTL